MTDDNQDRARDLIIQCKGRSLSQKDLADIARMIIKPFILAPQLGLKEGEVETIKYDNPGLEEQKYKILSRWKQKNGIKATLDRLISVLCDDLDWLDIAENIADHFKPVVSDIQEAVEEVTNNAVYQQPEAERIPTEETTENGNQYQQQSPPLQHEQPQPQQQYNLQPSQYNGQQMQCHSQCSDQLNAEPCNVQQQIQERPQDIDPMTSEPFVNHENMTETELRGEYDKKEKEIQKVEKDNIKENVSGLKNYTVLIEVVNDIEFMTAICQMEGEVYRCEICDDFTKSWSSYYFGKWKNVPVVVVQTGKQVGSQFQYGSWFETKKALYYMPQIKYVFGVGVCGAAVDVDGKPRVLMGHVVVSSHIMGYDHQKKAEYDQNRSFFSNCNENKFYHFLTHTPNKHKWDKGLKFGRVLSGSWLIANIEAQKSLLDFYRKDEVAFEMEGVGIAAACQYTNVKGWLVVKGVSDYANRDKNDNWQPAAARNATRFLSDMLNEGSYLLSDNQ